MPVSSLIALLGAGQGMFLSAMLLLRKKPHSSMVAMGIYIFLFSCGMLETFHDPQTAGIAQKLLFSFIANANLLYGPLLYFFVKYLKEPRIKLNTLLLHCLPFLIFVITDLLFISRLLYLPQPSGEVLDLIAFELLVIQLLTYSAVTLRMYQSVREHLLNTFSSINRSDVNWMMWLLYLIVSTYILSFLLSHLLIFGLISSSSIFVVIQALIALFTYTLGYRMFTRPSFFTIGFSSPPARYSRSGLKAEQAETQLKFLFSLMESEKPYKNAELSIFDVAAKLNMSRNHLTQLLNVFAKKNFFEFINSYRVAEAQQLLLNPDYSHLSLAGIGKEAGFKSTNAFYANFKKVTGETPAVWKQKRNGSQEAIEPAT